MNQPRYFSALLAFCMFSTGASGLVNEYVLATLTTYILGNSIEQFSIVIASMMLMMGVSGFVQSAMSDDNLIGKFVTLEATMAIICAFAPLAIYWTYANLTDHFLYVHYFFVLFVGFLIGFEIPLVMRIIEQSKVSLKTNLSLVYAMDYVGAFVGAILWVKFLLKNYPITEISFIVAGFNLLIAFITVIYLLRTKLIKNIWSSLILMITAALLLSIGYWKNQELSHLLEQKFYDDPIVYSHTTKYQHLVITENKQLKDIRLYINGNTQFSSLDEERYHDLLVHPVMSLAKPKTVLILGGGDGLALREVLKYKELDSITLVDLDPKMIELATNNQYLSTLNKNAFNDSRLKVLTAEGIKDMGVRSLQLATDDTVNVTSDSIGHNKFERVASLNVYNLDADIFLKNIENKKWDAIIIDFPDPSSIEINKLYTKQFYYQVKSRLTDEGFVAVQSTSPYHAKEVFLAIGLTLESVGFNRLPYRQNVPSFGDWGFHLAWKNSSTKQKVKARIKNINSFEVTTSFITPDVLVASLAFGKNELESKSNCINRLMSPCLMNQYLDYSWQVD
ncbi:MAG: spermidine synthase [Polaribacter sp.]|jgi:spermidine synthase